MPIRLLPKVSMCKIYLELEELDQGNAPWGGLQTPGLLPERVHIPVQQVVLPDAVLGIGTRVASPTYAGLYQSRWKHPGIPN